MSRGSSPMSSARSPLAETEQSGASSTALLTSGFECASPMPVIPASVWTLMMRMVWQPSPIMRTSGSRSMMPSMSVIFMSMSLRSPRRCEMGDTVAAFGAAEVTRADDDAGGAEMDRHRRPRRVVDEMDLAAELVGLDLLAQLDRRLEEPGLRREDVVVAATHLDEARRVRARRGARFLDDAGMGEEVANAAFDQCDTAARDRAGAAELAAERDDATRDRRTDGEAGAMGMGPDETERRPERTQRGHRPAIELGIVALAHRDERLVLQRRAAGMEVVIEIGEREQHGLYVVGDRPSRRAVGIAGIDTVEIAAVERRNAGGGERRGQVGGGHDDEAPG